MLYLKSQDSGIIQSILDRVSMQFLPILIVCRSGQLPFGLLFILFKNRCTSKAEPRGIWEELLYFIHIFRTQSTVTFIHDKDDMLAQQLFETFHISFLLLLLGMAQCGLQFLASRDDDCIIVRIRQQSSAEFNRAARTHNQTVRSNVSRRNTCIKFRGELCEF